MQVGLTPAKRHLRWPPWPADARFRFVCAAARGHDHRAPKFDCGNCQCEAPAGGRRTLRVLETSSAARCLRLRVLGFCRTLQGRMHNRSVWQVAPQVLSETREWRAQLDSRRRNFYLSRRTGRSGEPSAAARSAFFMVFEARATSQAHVEAPVAAQRFSQADKGRRALARRRGRLGRLQRHAGTAAAHRSLRIPG